MTVIKILENFSGNLYSDLVVFSTSKVSEKI